MRQVGTIPDQRRAKQFADYLLTLGMTTRVDNDPAGWAVWVHDERHVEKSRAELEVFLVDPDDSRFADVVADAEEIRREASRRNKQHAKQVVNMGRSWQRGTSGVPPATMVILLLMLVATIASNFGSNEPVAKWLYISWYNIVDVPTREVVEHMPEITRGQIWRLVTPAFMHGGIIHLAFGLYMFFQFGRLIEIRRGAVRLIGLVLIIAVISNLAEFWIADFKDWPVGGIIVPSARFLGMSGVIYGLFGYAWIRGRYDPSSGLRMNPQTVFFLMAWLVICLIGIMPIANVAHVAGLLVGMAVGYAPVLLERLSA